VIRQKSLQRELSRWIIFIALVFVLLGGGIAGFFAFNQARELQDHTLMEIAALIRAGKLNESRIIHHDIEKETIIINELGKKQHVPIIPYHIKDGLQTLELDGSRWRVFIITQKGSNRRFSVAQQTELRDEIALSSSLGVLLPLILLVLLMLFIIHFIIRRQFRSLRVLANSMHNQESNDLKSLPVDEVPIEIVPFVESINVLLERLKQTIQKQQRFIADAAHELRTPITALSLQFENMTKASNPQDRKSREEHMQQGLSRIRSLLSQLLDLARLQNEDHGQLQKVSLSENVSHVIADLHPLAEEKEIDLGMARFQENIYVNDSQQKLSQLIRNAVDNAIHYTPVGGKVDISVFRDGDNAIVKVEDTGIGIPEDELEQVMQPFHRVLATKQSGNGLGLAISYEIAQQLGGSIQLYNRPEGGLCFRYQQAVIV